MSFLLETCSQRAAAQSVRRKTLRLALFLPAFSEISTLIPTTSAQRRSFGGSNVTSGLRERLVPHPSTARSQNARGASKVFSSADEAIADLQDGTTILSAGFGLCGVAGMIVSLILASICSYLDQVRSTNPSPVLDRDAH